VTFIVTAVCVDCLVPPRLAAKGSLKVEPVPQDSGAWARAGYIPGLTRYLRTPVSGPAYYVLVEGENGWKSSDPLFAYPPDGDEPVRLSLNGNHRTHFDVILRELLAASRSRQVILVAEYNGGVTSPDLDDEAAEAVDVVGPITLDEFWRRHDQGEILEDSITILDAS
jgi:hypothetical protein